MGGQRGVPEPRLEALEALGNEEVRGAAAKSGCGSSRGNTKKMAEKVLLERPGGDQPKGSKDNSWKSTGDPRGWTSGTDKGPASSNRDRPDQPTGKIRDGALRKINVCR